MNTINNFSFWCPNDIIKAIDQETGEEIMRLGGIASTADEDSDGEFLDPKGFDIKPLLQSGMVNWHHQAKTAPATIVGEPTKAEIRKEGLYIETDLYKSSQIARDIWELAKTLAADSKTRRLGYSIEGKVLSRKSDDPSSPDYKKITKAIITGVAITHMPKNPKTFANIIKGEIDDDFDSDEEDKEDIEKNAKNGENDAKSDKGETTDTNRALIKEDVDKKVKVTTFSKAEVFEKIFCDCAGISIEKAKEIYNYILNITHMAKKHVITEEDIEKAYSDLGLDISKGCGSGNINKSDEEEDEEEDEEVDDDENSNEDEDETQKGDGDEMNEDEEDDDEGDDNDEDEDEDDKVTKAMITERFERIEKAMSISHSANVKYIKALGVMLKDSATKLEKATENLDLANSHIEELNDVIKAQEEEISNMRETLASYGSYTPAPKSMRHSAAVERFAKAQDNDIEKAETSSNVVSLQNKSVVSELLDQATFAKGFDDEFSKACCAFEATGTLSPNVIARLKNEFNVIVK